MRTPRTRLPRLFRLTGRSVRARIVWAVAGPLAAALIVGTAAVAALFSAGRVHDLDAQTLAEARALVAVVQGGDLPAVLPVPVGSTLLAQVLGSDGSVRAATPSASRVQPLVDPREGGQRVRTDEHGSYAGVPLRIRVETVGSGAARSYVVVAAPLTDVRSALAALRSVLLLIVPLLLAGVFAVVWRVAGLALRPVERLRVAAATQAADPAAAAPAALPVPDSGDEVARLATTLNGLLADLRRLVVREREFVADAAHELRSPLASMKVQLDVARAHPHHVALPALLDDLDAEVQRLNGLADDLLALARAEERTGARDRVDLRELADLPDGDGRGTDGAGPDRARSARPDPVVPRSPVEVLGDRAALQRLVDNLLSNARRHARTVQVTTAYEGGWAVLDVDDDGPGIPDADRERVFERWVRLDPSRDRAGGGVGLGLALARAIARAHGGDVVALTSPLGGARLRVRLPAAEVEP